MDLRNNNLIYDSLFQSDICQQGNTIQGSKFIWWDETIISTGVVKKDIAPVMVEGTKNSAIRIDTGASGLLTSVEQVLWFNNYAELDFFIDKLSFGVWIKQTVASSALLTIEFIDRNLAVGINIPLSVSQFTISSNNVINKWQQLKIEGLSIPNPPVPYASYEPIIGIRFKLTNTINNSIVRFSMPQANTGLTLNEFSPRVMDWSQYSGLEDFVYKLTRKQSVQIDVFGDSISLQSITSNTDVTSVPNYATYINKFITSKFGVTVTQRNNSASGSAFTNALLNYYRNAITNLSDLVIISHGRNVSSQTYNGTVADNLPIIESLIRRIRTASPRSNVLLTLPFFRRMDSGGIGEAAYSNYCQDEQFLEFMKYMSNVYGVAGSNTAEKLKVAGDKGLWWAMYGIAGSAGENTHPFWVGHTYYANEFKHVIWGSYLNNKLRSYSNNSSTIETLTPSYEAATILFPSQFLTPGTYQDGTGMAATVNTVTGTWVSDTNIDSAKLAANKQLIGAGTLANVSGFGCYEMPKVTVNQGDSINVSWAGKYFMIWFAPCNNRGNALITINGVQYTFNTLDSNGILTKHVYPTFTNCISGANPSALSALPVGTNTIQIEQKDNIANAQISIVAIALF